jgi:hypothetical protein
MPKSILLAGVVLLALVFAAYPRGATQTAGSINGTVRDPAGALIVSAQVSIRNDTTGEVRNTTTNNEGRFKFDNLAPGGYTISVSQTGFKALERSSVIDSGRSATVEIRLEVAALIEKVEVGAKGGVTPNSEPNYRQLRDGGAMETYTVNNLALKRDAGTITLRTGRVSFLPPVIGHVVRAVFVGDGQFTLTPVMVLERDYLRRITQKEAVDESFDKAVFCFTDETYDEIKRQAERPRSLVEYLLAFEGENIDAEILADLYNPKRPGFFSAYIFGRKYDDLRFYVKPGGVLPQMLAPEEVALINLDPGGEREGIWYLAHLSSEYQSGSARSDEDKRIIDVQH